MELMDIKDLILTIDKTSIESVEIEKGEMKIRINKRGTNESEFRKVSNVGQFNEASNEAGSLTADNKPPAYVEDLLIIKSPMVGTYYSGPSPDSPPFVKVGARVEKGQTLCIVEAMKMMNEIKSEATGEVVEILAIDEDILQYGQPLMRIRG